MSTPYQRGLKAGKKAMAKRIMIGIQKLVFDIIVADGLVDKKSEKNKK